MQNVTKHLSFISTSNSLSNIAHNPTHSLGQNNIKNLVKVESNKNVGYFRQETVKIASENR